MARPTIRYKINGLADIRDSDYGSCVYKLSYGRGFVIVKGLLLYGSLLQIQKSLNQYAKGSLAQRKKTTLYYKFFEYIVKHPDNVFKVQVLVHDNSPYKLLRAEQHYIKKGRKNKFCMNVRRGAYVNQWNPEKQMYNWLPVNAVLNFNRYKDKPYIE